MEKKNAQLTATIGDKVFLISGCELMAYEPPPESYTPWWRESPVHTPLPVPSIQNPVVMEGSSWHRVAAEQGARLRPNMRQGKVYLYQLYTTCFAEFYTLEQAQAFRQQIGEADPYWDYDPVATIDTNDPETVQRWAEFMEGD